MIFTLLGAAGASESDLVSHPSIQVSGGAHSKSMKGLQDDVDEAYRERDQYLQVISHLMPASGLFSSST